MQTIFALSTPPGKSGIAVIRISGVAAKEALHALCVTPLPAPRVATLATLYEPDDTGQFLPLLGGGQVGVGHTHHLGGQPHPNPPLKGEGKEKADHIGAVIDKALILWFPAPHSFTGEDVVELHIHGSRAVLRQLLAVFSALPSLRAALPGEFTHRAFLNGKMDLTAAEGLADLIDAETEAQKKQALRHMQGEAAGFYAKLRAGILHALAFLEAYIDFPDEDIPQSVNEEINKEIQNITSLLEHQLADKGTAERTRDGIAVAILGPPNVGKSSLMNLLAGRDVAIVSQFAGTTRDVIEVHLDIGGYCVILSDTAGIREHAGEIEEEGIRRSFEQARQADIRIVVIDKHTMAAEELKKLVNADTILLLNKSDLALPSPLPAVSGITAIPVSVKKREGIDALMRALEERIASLQGAESSFITRSRHRRHLALALGHLRHYTAQSHAGIELRCEELRRAATEIGKITGSIAVDELLGHIFASFCIGK